MTVTINIRTYGKAFNKRCVTEYMVKPAIKQTLDEGVDILKSLTPVRTGKMRDAWELNLSTRTIDNDVPYAKFIDLGTRFIQPFNITKQALPRIKDRFRENLQRNIENLNT